MSHGGPDQWRMLRPGIGLVQNGLVRDGLVRPRPEKTSDCRRVRRLKELEGVDDNHQVRPEIVVRLSFLSVPPRVQQGM